MSGGSFGGGGLGGGTSGGKRGGELGGGDGGGGDGAETTTMTAPAFEAITTDMPMVEATADAKVLASLLTV